MQSAAEFLDELLDDLALVVAQVQHKMRLIGYQRHVLVAKAADPAMARELRRQAAAHTGGHRRQQARALFQRGMYPSHQ